MAVLALLIRVVVPPGFMPGDARSSGAFRLVLCTGQGPMIVDAAAILGAGGGTKAPSDQGDHDGPCAFAGQAAAVAEPDVFHATPVVFLAYRPLAAARLVSAAPGRGLAAPPLPARGPPSLLI